MSDDRVDALEQRVADLERRLGPEVPRCTCTFWTASIPPMPASDGTCLRHPVRGLWRDGKEPGS